MPFHDIVFGNEELQQPPQMPGGFAALQDANVPPEVMQAATPPKDPQDFQRRREGWMEFAARSLQDPNVARALMYTGAVLLQPTPPGQTPLGHLGQALIAGRTAFDLGQQAEFERQQQQAEEARKTAESKARVGLTEEQTRRVKTQTDFDLETANDRAAKIRVEAQKAALELQQAQDRAEIERIMNKHMRRRAEILADLPDERMRKLVQDELDKAGVDNDLRRAQAQRERALAGEAGARASKTKMETEALSGLTPEQRLEYFSRTGAFGPAGRSALEAQERVLGQIYDRLPDSDPNKKNMTRDQFIYKNLKGTSDKALMDLYLKAQSLGLPSNDPAMQWLSEAVESIRSSQPQGQSQQRSGQPRAGWDPKTKNVYLNGVIIGQADSKREAEELARKVLGIR